jgi:formylglycine-generating enzyme required for sulfatase activity
MQVGHAYHIRGVWDGEQLTFTKEIEEDDFELEDIPGENIAGSTNENPTGKDIETFTVNGVSFNMVRVEGGTFMMGVPDEWRMSTDDPCHEVTLSTYYIGQTEVTNELLKAVTGRVYSWNFAEDKQPANAISWLECEDFMAKLSEITGVNFRFPTEAEWEYAARGGKYSHNYRFSGSNNADEVYWYNCKNPQEVGLKHPNELGLYDMSGNVWEWCYDWYSKETIFEPQTNPTGPESPDDYHSKVLRGGCWRDWDPHNYVWIRGGTKLTYTWNTDGLRIVYSGEESEHLPDNSPD